MASRLCIEREVSTLSRKRSFGPHIRQWRTYDGVQGGHPLLSIARFQKLALGACIFAAAYGAHAGIVSSAIINRGGGDIIFDLYDEPAKLRECTGRNDMWAVVRFQVKGKLEPYGTGCWSAGADGFITLKIKSFDDGIVRTSRLHNSEFKQTQGAPIPPAQSSQSGFSPWVFTRASSNQGTPVCALYSEEKGAKGVRNIAIKALANRDALNITLYDDHWNHKPDIKHTASLDFDDRKPLELLAYGDGKLLFADLPVSATAVFLSLLAEKQKLKFYPPNAPAISVGLSGINRALTQFMDCARSIK